MNIEIGPGRSPQPGYIGVDADPCALTHVRGDCAQLPLRSSSVANMRSYDVLEHVSYRATARVLEEWARVLRDGGRLDLRVPDAEGAILRAVEQGLDRSIEWLNWHLLGGHDDGTTSDWRYNAHHTLWSERSLSDALERAGFEVETIARDGHPNLIVTARKRTSDTGSEVG